MQVYILDVKNISFEECRELIEFLTPKRREKVNRLLDEKKKVVSIYTELLIRKAIGANQSIEIYYNEYGKPYLNEPKGVFFSVAHCKEKIVCVIDNCAKIVKNLGRGTRLDNFSFKPRFSPRP